MRAYRPTWNGVLRLFNLLQSLLGARRTTRVGARSDLYRELVPAAEGPAAPGLEAEVGAGPSPGENWKEAIGLAAPELFAAEKAAEALFAAATYAAEAAE